MYFILYPQTPILSYPIHLASDLVITLTLIGVRLLHTNTNIATKISRKRTILKNYPVLRELIGKALFNFPPKKSIVSILYLVFYVGFRVGGVIYSILRTLFLLLYDLISGNSKLNLWKQRLTINLLSWFYFYLGSRDWEILMVNCYILVHYKRKNIFWWKLCKSINN